MDFDFNEDQQMLRDSVRRWAEKACSFEQRRAAVAAGGMPQDTWRQLNDLGLCALSVPQAHGGLDFGPVEAMVVMEELGRALVLAPYAEVCLIATSVLRDHAEAGLAAAWLPRIADGSARVVLAHQERQARYRLAHVSTTARQTDAGWVLTGHKSLVPAGDRVDAWIVPARVSGSVDEAQGLALFLVEAGDQGARLRAHPLQDGSRAAELLLDQAAGQLLVPADRGLAALTHAVDVGIAAGCAEAVGAMERLLEITIDYLNTRKQFGVVIASFQALRHRIADMKMQLELARSMSYFATLKLTHPADARRRAVSQAKVQIGQSIRYVGQQAVQLHGGIAVTDEYIASHYFKRLTCIELAYGDTAHHLGEVSARMQDQAGVFA